MSFGKVRGFQCSYFRVWGLGRDAGLVGVCVSKYVGELIRFEWLSPWSLCVWMSEFWTGGTIILSIT